MLTYLLYDDTVLTCYCSMCHCLPNLCCKQKAYQLSTAYMPVPLSVNDMEVDDMYVLAGRSILSIGGAVQGHKFRLATSHLESPCSHNQMFSKERVAQCKEVCCLSQHTIANVQHNVSMGTH